MSLYGGVMSAAFWFCAAITAVSAYVSFGYSVVGLAGATPASRAALMYAFARSLALAVAATVALLAHSVAFLEAVALTMVIVQSADAIIGGVLRERLKTIGPAATAVLNAAALIWLLQQ